MSKFRVTLSYGGETGAAVYEAKSERAVVATVLCELNFPADLPRGAIKVERLTEGPS